MRAISCPATSSMTTNCGSLTAGGSGDLCGGGDADQGDEEGEGYGDGGAQAGVRA